MAVKFEVLREVWRITERRGGAVYKTEFVERRWVPLADASLSGRPDGDEDLIWASVTDPKIKTHRTAIVDFDDEE